MSLVPFNLRFVVLMTFHVYFHCSGLLQLKEFQNLGHDRSKLDFLRSMSCQGFASEFSSLCSSVHCMTLLFYQCGLTPLINS